MACSSCMLVTLALILRASGAATQEEIDKIKGIEALKEEMATEDQPPGDAILNQDVDDDALGVPASKKTTCSIAEAEVPTAYATIEGDFVGGNEEKVEWARVQNAQGCDEFEAWVYLEVPEGTYDKRVINAAYVQTFPAGCDVHIECDGQKGGNEYDVLETGFTGFTSTEVVNNAFNCEKHCSGTECEGLAAGSSGCSWPSNDGGHAVCQVGDHGSDCAGVTTCAEAAASGDVCVWNAAEDVVRYCTQVSELDPTAQDFTKNAANAYFQGKAGVETWTCTSTGSARCNDCPTAHHYQIDSGDLDYGNRWVRLRAQFGGNSVTYYYDFYAPGDASDRSVAVVEQSSLTLTLKSGDKLLDPCMKHYWVFSIWKTEIWGAIPSTEVPDGKRKLHYYVPTAQGQPDLPQGSMPDCPEEADAIAIADIAGAFAQQVVPEGMQVPEGASIFAGVLAMLVLSFASVAVARQQWRRQGVFRLAASGADFEE